MSDESERAYVVVERVTSVYDQEGRLVSRRKGDSTQQPPPPRSAQTWVRDPPTKPGWYWFFQDGTVPVDPPSVVHFVEGDAGRLEIWFNGWDMPETLDEMQLDRSWWLGPVSEPPPPGR